MPHPSLKGVQAQFHYELNCFILTIISMNLFHIRVHIFLSKDLTSSCFRIKIKEMKILPTHSLALNFHWKNFPLSRSLLENKQWKFSFHIVGKVLHWPLYVWKCSQFVVINLKAMLRPSRCRRKILFSHLIEVEKV